MALIGAMREQVAVENPTRTADGEGGFTDSWAAASPSPVWAQITPATATNVERLVGATIEAPIHALITVRYHASITTKTRLVFGSRIFLVRGAQNIHERDQFVVCACEEN